LSETNNSLLGGSTLYLRPLLLTFFFPLQSVDIDIISVVFDVSFRSYQLKTNNTLDTFTLIFVIVGYIRNGYSKSTFMEGTPGMFEVKRFVENAELDTSVRQPKDPCFHVLRRQSSNHYVVKGFTSTH